MLGAAGQLMDGFARKYPREKPPYVEGDLYSSSFEGPTSATVERVSYSGQNRAVADVRLDYVDAVNNDVWRDRVHLRVENGVWKVADFDLNAGYAFGNSGSLLKELYANLIKPVPDVGYRGAVSCRPKAAKQRR